jgi:AraC-like DNA-binding protein
MKRIDLLKVGGPPLALNRMEPQDEMDLHWHGNVELAVITGGHGYHSTGDGTWPLRRGDIFIIPVGMGHGYVHLSDLCLINVGYDPQRLPLARLAALPGYTALCVLEPSLRRHQAFAGHLHLEEDDLAQVVSLIDHLGVELQRREPGWETAAEGWLVQLLILLARRYAAHDTPAARLVLRLQRVMSHLEAHLAEPVTQEELAHVGGMSRATLQRLFTACHGTSVIDHLNRLRVARARELLTTTAQPIAAIGRAVGFANPNYFSRVFARVAGLTPGQARNGSGSPTRPSRRRATSGSASARD